MTTIAASQNKTSFAAALEEARRGMVVAEDVVLLLAAGKVSRPSLHRLQPAFGN